MDTRVACECRCQRGHRLLHDQGRHGPKRDKVRRSSPRPVTDFLSTCQTDKILPSFQLVDLFRPLFNPPYLDDRLVVRALRRRRPPRARRPEGTRLALGAWSERPSCSYTDTLLAEKIIKSDFVLLSGDVVSNLNLMEAVKAHRERRKVSKECIMTLVVKESATDTRHR